MVELLDQVMVFFSTVLDLAGVGAILIGFAFGAVRAVQLTMAGSRAVAYTTLRSVFGKSLLLGLEILVAADLVRTITVAPTINGLYMLGLLILIRSFLSWSLDVELEGTWPWNRHKVAGMRDSDVSS